MNINYFLHYLTVCSLKNESSLTNYCNNACTDLFNYPFKSYSKNCYVSLNPISWTPQLIQQNGYEFESYNITTPDGYILTLFRIPPKKNDVRKKKQPIYLQHGIMTDSAVWVNKNDRSLAFILADQGYDVWLGSQRGTTYGRLHARLSDSDPEFWNFDLEDQAINDIRSSLKEIANITQKDGSIIYLGHSKGTTMFFVYASEYPEEAQKLLKGSIALGPIAYLGLPVFKQILYNMGLSIVKFLGIKSLFFNMERVENFVLALCSFLPHLCKLQIVIEFGPTSQFLPSDLLTYFSKYPLTAGVKEIEHYIQISNSGKFQKYDLGKEKNLIKYGQESPPSYKLVNIKVPVYLLHGENDHFTTPQSVSKIFKELGSTRKKIYSIPIHKKSEEYRFNHIDFTYSKYLKKFLYNDLLQILENKLSII